MTPQPLNRPCGVDVLRLKAIAAGDSDTAKTNALINAANEIERLRSVVQQISAIHAPMYREYLDLKCAAIAASEAA